LTFPSSWVRPKPAAWPRRHIYSGEGESHVDVLVYNEHFPAAATTDFPQRLFAFADTSAGHAVVVASR
jgi:hypothetical protein